MASSGSFNTSGYNGLYLNFSWSTVEQSITDNRTKIYWELKGTGNHNYYAGNFKVLILGEPVFSSSDRILLSNGTLVASGYFNIWHDNTGNRTFDAYVEAGIYTYAVNCKGSLSWALDTIPRASVINSFSGNDIEGNFRVIYTSYSNAFTNKLRISIPNVKVIETFDNYASGTDVYFSNSSLAYLYSYMQNLPSVELGAVIETWNGNTKIGESTELINTFSIDNALPTITASVEADPDTIALTGNKNTLIKFFSNAKATMTAEAHKGASIDENLYIIRNGSDTGYGTTHTFNNVESNRFSFSAEDSRGSVGTATVIQNMVEYIKLTCNIANNRPDALGNVNVVCTGSYFNATFGAVANSLQVQYRYSISGGTFSDWADMDITITGNSYTAYKDFDIPDFSQDLYYSFETRAIDKLDEVVSASGAVKSIPIFDWGENDFAFNVPVAVSGDLDVTGDLRLKGDENYGNTLRFGDSDYCYIAEPVDDAMVIHARTSIELDAPEVIMYGSTMPVVAYGSWTPTLVSGAVSSYTTQYGWYCKVGQVVTVGFYIKANCNSGNQNTNVKIFGVPYTPITTATGGGLCSGAYVSGGYTFQCYAIDDTGTITTRVQVCNNTSAANLITSASGCNFPSGGGTITLSGTITFMTTT